jgi:hypothetical protein
MADILSNSQHKALADKIVACGDAIRDAKAAKVSKAELEPLLAELLALKASFKEATGEDYVSPAQQKGKRKVENAAPKPSASSKDGPSKNELKKLAKAAKKSEKKPSSSNDAAPSVTNSNKPCESSQPVAQLCVLSFSDGDIVTQVDVVKCLAAASLAGVEHPAVCLKPEQTLPSLFTGNARIALIIPASGNSDQSLLFGANSIVRYYMSMVNNAAWSADEWLEWEENSLSAAMCRLLALVPDLPIAPTSSDTNDYLVDFDEYRQIYQYSIMATEGLSEYKSASSTGTTQESLSTEASSAFSMLVNSLQHIEAGIKNGKIGKELSFAEYSVCCTLQFTISKILPLGSSLVGENTQELLDSVTNSPIFRNSVASASQLDINAATATEPSTSEQPKFCGGFVSYLEECFTIATKIAYPDAVVKPGSVQRSKHFAHYQCNSSMSIFQVLSLFFF